VGNYRLKAVADFWGGLYTTWDWEGWVKPQIDDIASVSNAVRFFGTTSALADGSMTLDLYLSRWRQVLDYASSLGLYMYPCAADLRHWGYFSTEQAVQMYRELASLLANYSNVIGVDITNEAFGALNEKPEKLTYRQHQPVDELLSELGDTVRSSGLPITHSRNIDDPGGWTEAFFTDYLGDYLDFHVYYPPGPGDSQQIYGQSWASGKKLVIGEFGENLLASPEDRSNFYNAVRLMCANDLNCLGAFAWAAWDQGPAPANMYGLFDDERQLRVDIGDTFRNFRTETGS
jgi:hypothetical protein